MNIRITYGGLNIDGKNVPLYSASIHYWRLEKNLWGKLLDKVKKMGFQVISTYIPWSIHEIKRGKFDFGEIDEKKDLNSFLSLCAKKDLYILVRPGPHINAELPYFGYPKRMLLDSEVQAKAPQGTSVILLLPPKHFPIPNYSSEKFYSEVALYFDALCPILLSHVYPKGRIIGMQIDNELPFFFASSPYDLGYSRDSIELYRNFLKNKYKKIISLNKSYRSGYISFKEIQPPREFLARRKEELPFYLDWAEYKEYYIIYAIKRIVNLLKERGIKGIPFFHNYPTIYPRAPLNMSKAEEILGVQGVDNYSYKEGYERIKIGVEYTTTTSRMPFITEFGSGYVPWAKPLMPEDERFTTLATFMHGIKAINYYMIVERESWLGSPITRDNRRRDSYFRLYQKLNQVLKKINYMNLKKKNDLLLLTNRDYDKLGWVAQSFSPPTHLFIFLHLIGGFPWGIFGSENTFGFKDCIQIEAERWWRNFYKALSISGYSFGLGDTNLSLKKLIEYPLIIVPVFEFMDSLIQKKFVRYVKEGGILVIGPRCPKLDEEMRKSFILANLLKEAVETLPKAITEDGFEVREANVFDTPAFLRAEEKTISYIIPYGKGKIIHLGFLTPKEFEPSLVTLINKICKEAGIKREIWLENTQVDFTIHENKSSKFIFLANPTNKEKRTKIKAIFPLKLKDVWSNQRIREPEISIEPYTIKILEVM